MAGRRATRPLRGALCAARRCLRKAERGRIIDRQEKRSLGRNAMTALSRRDFLALSTSAAAVTLAGPARAVMGPNDKFDLVIKGGDVLDPSQSLRAKRDIGIRWGVVEAIEREHPRRARAQDHRRLGQARHCRASSTCIAMSTPMARRSASPPTSWCSSRAPRQWSPRAMPASTISRRCVATSWRSRARACMPSSTSPTTGCPRFPSPSSTTSTTRRSKPARWRLPKTPTS